MDLEQLFENYAKFGDSNSDGTRITLTNVDKWLKQANVIDGKNITTADTGVLFSKQQSKTITFEQFDDFLYELARDRRVGVEDIKSKLLVAGIPDPSNVTQPVKLSVVDRLTDTSRYTGIHRERFDEEGRGRGLSGSADIADDRGYVTGYKNADTYDKTH